MGADPARLAPGPATPAAGLSRAGLQPPRPRLPTRRRHTHLRCDNQNVSSDTAKHSQGDKAAPFENPWVEANVSWVKMLIPIRNGTYYIRDEPEITVLSGRSQTEGTYCKIPFIGNVSGIDTCIETEGGLVVAREGG